MGRELSLSVASLRAAYPNANLPAETVAIYVAALEGSAPDDVQDAVVSLIRSSQFFPTVNEILARIAEHRLRLPNRVEAWTEAVARSESRWESDRTPIVTDALNAIGGVWAIRTSENPVATRAQFLKFFDELRAARIDHFMQTGRPIDETPALAAVEEAS